MRSVFPVLMAVASAAFGAPHTIEQRSTAAWPTANHFRFSAASRAAAGQPVWVDIQLPKDFHPDSVRVLGKTDRPRPAKTDWRVPNARISWISDGLREYYVYFDRGQAGETRRWPEPAMIGTGDRITYGRPNVRGKLAVGLWAHPAPLDMDKDATSTWWWAVPIGPRTGSGTSATSALTPGRSLIGPSGLVP